MLGWWEVAELYELLDRKHMECPFMGYYVKYPQYYPHTSFPPSLSYFPYFLYSTELSILSLFLAPHIFIYTYIYKNVCARVGAGG